MKHRLSGLKGYPYIQKLRSIERFERLNIQASFNEIVKQNSKFIPQNLGALAIEYKLPVAAMSEILEDLECLPVGTWERLKARGCTAGAIGVKWS
jgi:hypothetical protein